MLLLNPLEGLGALAPCCNELAPGALGVRRCVAGIEAAGGTEAANVLGLAESKEGRKMHGDGALPLPFNFCVAVVGESGDVCEPVPECGVEMDAFPEQYFPARFACSNSMRTPAILDCHRKYTI